MGIAAIDRIRSAGFMLKAEGDRLTVTGSRPLSDQQRRFIKAHKWELLAATKLRQVPGHPMVQAALETFPGAEIVDIRDAREERAAILEFDAGLPRPIAEVMADHEMLLDPHNPDTWK